MDCQYVSGGESVNGEESAPDGTPVSLAFNQGLERLHAGDASAALDSLRRAYEAAPRDARVRSYYGLAIGAAERRFETAVELCRDALKQEFFNPELYLNMARLHLAFGFKAEGLRYLRRGQMIDPADRTIARELRALGARQRQVLGFLSRTHPINRMLGRARNRMARFS